MLEPTKNLGWTLQSLYFKEFFTQNVRLKMMKHFCSGLFETFRSQSGTILNILQLAKGLDYQLVDPAEHQTV